MVRARPVKLCERLRADPTVGSAGGCSGPGIATAGCKTLAALAFQCSFIPPLIPCFFSSARCLPHSVVPQMEEEFPL
jgi:hypothetical protein